MPTLNLTKPVFQPARRTIASITQSFPAVVTTDIDNSYLSGLIVQIVIPVGHGMPQLNGAVVPITVTATNTFTIPVDTSSFDPFIAQTDLLFPYSYQYAQAIPTGELTTQLTQSVRNVLPYQG